MITYARQGGTSSIFINDDGLQLLPAPERDARIAFYATHGIGWVARPAHGADPTSGGGFTRAGRFKKASNMNYGLVLSLKLERHLAALRRERDVGTPSTGQGSRNGHGYGHGAAGSGRLNAGSNAQLAQEDMEERALEMAIEEVYEESGKRFRPWAAHGKAIRMGEIVLLVDSDTIVPEVCQNSMLLLSWWLDGGV
jgi:hypothetical protein